MLATFNASFYNIQNTFVQISLLNLKILLQLRAARNKRSKYNTRLWPQGVYKFMALVTGLSLRKMSLIFYQQPASVLCSTARSLFYLHKMNLASDTCSNMLQWCSLRLKVNSGGLELSFLILGGTEQNKTKISLMLVYNSLKTVPSTL